MPVGARGRSFPGVWEHAVALPCRLLALPVVTVPCDHTALKKWLLAQSDQPATLAELQSLLHRVVELYNHHRSHRSLPHRATPATIYTTLPEPVPAATAAPTPTTASAATRSTRPAASPCASPGNLRHIGVSRTHARTDVILLAHDLHVTVINAATGEILRDLIIDPRRDYQPTGRPPGTRKAVGRTCRSQVRPTPMP